MNWILIWYDEDICELNIQEYKYEEDLIEDCEKSFIEPDKCIVLKGNIVDCMKLKNKLSLVKCNITKYKREEDENGKEH